MFVYLTSISSVLCLLFESGKTDLVSTLSSSTVWDDTNNTASVYAITDFCQAFEPVENGFVEIRERFAEIKCKQMYYLDGPPIVSCLEGKWLMFTRPKCIPLCYPPPLLANGTVRIDGEKDSSGFFRQGAVATYACHQGYKLTPSAGFAVTRVCIKGTWTEGHSVSCTKITNCLLPKEISNGYFVHENKFGQLNDIGQRLHYNCKTGFRLEGSPFQLCLDDGTWSPKKQPKCFPQITEEGNIYSCIGLPKVPHSEVNVVEGSLTANEAEPQTIIEFRCIQKYRNIVGSCKPSRMTCVNGRWVNLDKFPAYCVQAHNCEPPPLVPFALVRNFNVDVYEASAATRQYPLNSKVVYRCFPGFSAQGSTVLTCTMDGCWSPEPPTCVRMTPSSFLDVNNLKSTLITAASGVGVLGILFVICMICVWSQRNRRMRTVPIPTPVQRIDLGDHATLLAHPDRLALIAFADGMQNDQATLPTYDEATRDRAPSLISNRLHRPHWPVNLGGRRTRNIPDLVHVTRHGSFASHTPSTRSAGDSMGSTDTVAVSEGSTNVTLDTASSYSGSQPASCRVHCGSLASFDTSSVINNEGVPLLEESELEEIQGGDDNISLVMDNNNPSICDNASYKLSTNVSLADLP